MTILGLNKVDSFMKNLDQRRSQKTAKLPTKISSVRLQNVSILYR